jgi:ABC-2 type transport system ATP-binding protein
MAGEIMPSDTDLCIDLRGVRKIYKGRVEALRGIEMRVHRGEIFGLLGPNGAGKSTLVKIIMKVIRPTAAQGTLLGRAIGDTATLARVGYLPENHRFPRYLTGRQVLHFFAALAGVERRERRRRAGEMLELVGMTDAADRRISTYSKGMMQRIGLGNALMNHPDLVLLDEPTDGVDPIGRQDIRRILQGLRQQGKTVFVNSHILSELEMICDRVAILVQGLVVRQGTLAELALGLERYEIEVAGPPQSVQIWGCLGLAGDRLPGGQPIGMVGNTVVVATADPAVVQSLIDRLRSAGHIIGRVELVRPSLESIFISTVRNEGAPTP